MVYMLIATDEDNTPAIAMVYGSRKRAEAAAIEEARREGYRRVGDQFRFDETDGQLLNRNRGVSNLWQGLNIWVRATEIVRG